MPERRLTREDQIVAFFVNRSGGEVGRTRLMKLMYLADYEARRYLGRPISNVKYIWYHYGPYDPQLPTRIEGLKRANVINEERVRYPSGKDGFVYTPGPTPVSFALTPVEIEILSFVCRQYSMVQLKELLDDIVYETEPMVRAKRKGARNKPLEMDMVNKTGGKELAVPFEVLFERSARVRAGKYVGHADAMQRVAAGGPQAVAI